LDNTTTSANYLINYLNNVFIDSVEPSNTISINDKISNNVLGCLLLKLFETGAIDPSKMHDNDVIMIRNRIRMYPPGLSLEMMSYTNAINEAFLVPAITDAINTIAAPRVDILIRESKRLGMYYKESKLRSMINNEQARMLKNEVQFMNVNTQMKAKLNMLYTRYKVIDRDPDATYVFNHYNKAFNNGININTILKSNSINTQSSTPTSDNQTSIHRLNRVSARNTIGSTSGISTSDISNQHDHTSNKGVVSVDHVNELSSIEPTEHSESETTEAPPAREHVEAPPAREHVEAPPAREHVEAPPAREHVEAPPAREHVEAPPAREHVETHAPANQNNDLFDFANVFDGIEGIE
jgi:hypothetical protein